MTKPRGVNFKNSQSGKMTNEKVKISYLEFAQKVVSGFGKVDNPIKAKAQVTALMKIRDLKVKDIAEMTGLSYDLCRRFKQISERYEPIDVDGDEISLCSCGCGQQPKMERKDDQVRIFCGYVVDCGKTTDFHSDPAATVVQWNELNEVVDAV